MLKSLFGEPLPVDPTWEAVIDILMSDAWDPLGVGRNPNLRDEYEGVARLILPLLEAGPDPSQIAAILREFDEDLGIGSLPEDRYQAVASQLISLQR
ncbi:MAG: hypothetical protein JWR84_2337 [Caulobacter sp.]|nr:hypothetical protein [Caulobacter sp.]